MNKIYGLIIFMLGIEYETLLFENDYDRNMRLEANQRDSYRLFSYEIEIEKEYINIDRQYTIKF